MTKKGRTLLVLTALAILLTGGWAAIRWFGTREESGPASSGEEVLFAEESDLLLSVRIGTDAETLTFSRDNDGLVWEMKEYPGAKADAEKIGRILDAVSPLKAIRRLEGNVEDTGFGDGAVRLALATADTEKIFWIGEENRALEGVYLRAEGDETVYIVPRELSEAVRHTSLYFMEPDRFPYLLSPEAVRVNGLSLVYREDGSDQIWSDDIRWFFKDSDTDYAGTDEVDGILNTVRKSAFLEVAGRWDDTAFLNRSGLSEPEAVFSADWYENGEKKTFCLLIGRSFSGEDGARLCYAAVEGSDYISVLKEEVKDTLLAVNEKSLFPHTALPVDWETVERVEISHGGEEHLIGISRETRDDTEGEKRETLVFREEERELDEKAAESFFDALSALTAESEAEEGASGEEPVLSITLYRNTERFRTMTFELLPYDPLFLRVRFDGRDFLLVGKADADKLFILLDRVFSGSQE